MEQVNHVAVMERGNHVAVMEQGNRVAVNYIKLTFTLHRTYIAREQNISLPHQQLKS